MYLLFHVTEGSTLGLLVFQLTVASQTFLPWRCPIGLES